MFLGYSAAPSRSFNQGGYQIREDFKARRISDARCISHLLHIPREDVTAKCCI